MSADQKTLLGIPTNVISGFLGVGKTSAILNLLSQKSSHERWAVLVNEFGEIAKSKGFLLVSSSPLRRSSYHADEDFRKLQDTRNKQLECHQHQ